MSAVYVRGCYVLYGLFLEFIASPSPKFVPRNCPVTLVCRTQAAGCRVAIHFQELGGIAQQISSSYCEGMEDFKTCSFPFSNTSKVWCFAFGGDGNNESLPVWINVTGDY